MISVQVNQQILRGGQRYPKERLARVLREVERVVGRRSYEISIAFVSPRQMRLANRRYRGKDRVTDVLSFALTEQSGELLLSYDQAKKQAKEMPHSVRDEITFLIVHGILHLFGHDHERAKDAKKMFALQEKILTNVGVDPRL